MFKIHISENLPYEGKFKMVGGNEENIKFNVVGRSLNWRYTIDNGTVKFFRIKNGVAYWCKGGQIKVGDFVWVDTIEGKWGLMKAPNNTLRKSLWEHGHNSSQKYFTFGCDKAELKEAYVKGLDYEGRSMADWKKRVDGTNWFEETVMVVSKDMHTIAVIHLSRTWEQKRWEIRHIYVSPGMANKEVGDAISNRIKEMNSSYYLCGGLVELN